jgi:hypothetical protein
MEREWNGFGTDLERKRNGNGTTKWYNKAAKGKREPPNSSRKAAGNDHANFKIEMGYEV